MTVFCDTSVLVAAAHEDHEHHGRALPIVSAVKAKTLQGCLASHSLAETYSVLTRLPAPLRVSPETAHRILAENYLPHFKAIALRTEDYGRVIADLSRRGISGGAVYDALIIRCAERSESDRIYTFNVGQFQSIAPHLREKIVAP